jgi:uncharacterized protein (TIGR02271 family)
MSHEKIVAVYDTVAHADAALNTLRLAGYPTSDVSIIKNEGEAKAGLSDPGFWQSLFGEDLDLHEAEVYGRTVRQGGAVLAVRVLESDAPKVIDLLDAHRPVDVMDRARSYGLGALPKIAVPPPTMAATPPAATLASAAATLASTIMKKDEEVVRLAEEQLDIGKRKIESGKTRARRFVVEKPVEANVNLHEEHVEIMRRAISEPGYLKDIDWSEQVFEVTDTAEQPVVSKSVRLTEEVVIRRKGSDHVETVHDTVRRQQLDIERVPLEAIKK